MIKTIAIVFLVLLVLSVPEVYPFVALIGLFLLSCYAFIQWIRGKLK